MDIYTIGFTKHSAERIFEKLRSANVTRLVDVRLNNVFQLAASPSAMTFATSSGGCATRHTSTRRCLPLVRLSGE